MYVKRTNNINDILRVVPIEVKLREKERTKVRTKEFLEFIQMQLMNPLFYFLMIFEDDTEQAIVGYMALVVIPIKLMDLQQVNILRVYYDPKYRETNIKQTLENAVILIARQHRITDIRIEVTGRERAIARSWGFKKRGIVMERRIEYGK